VLAGVAVLVPVPAAAGEDDFGEVGWLAVDAGAEVPPGWEALAGAAAEDGDVGAYVVADDGAEPAGLVPVCAPG
jgi:hypothetical protein